MIRGLLLTLLLIATSLSTISCECDSCGVGPDHPPRLQISEDNVLNDFQVAYRQRRIDGYAKLLATDFQFYLDPVTSSELGVTSWARTPDSLATGRLFLSPQVTNLAIELDWQPRSAVNAGLPAPRETWTTLVVSDVYLDFDYAPAGQDTTTFRVENQVQQFYFRRGRTNPPSGPADTLVYLVEWHDQGVSNGLRAPRPLVEPTTWSRIKTRFGTTN